MPFLGVELAVRCERSEHGKSQLSLKFLCTIFIPPLRHLFYLYTFFLTLHFSLICQTTQNFQPYLTLFFRFPIALRCPKMAYNVVATLRGRGAHKGLGGRCTCKFAQMFVRTYTPALAKLLVICCFFIHQFHLCNLEYLQLDTFCRFLAQ